LTLFEITPSLSDFVHAWLVCNHCQDEVRAAGMMMVVVVVVLRARHGP